MKTNLVAPDILTRFGVDPDQSTITPLGEGNINDTFLVVGQNHKFVLQKINSSVFPDPKAVIDNFSLITSHLQNQDHCNEESHHSSIRYATPLYTKEKSAFVIDQDKCYWRAQSYVENTDIVPTIEESLAHSIGNILAIFHSRLADLDLALVKVALPGFHDLAGYLKDFDALEVTPATQSCEMTALMFQKIANYRKYTERFFNVVKEGTIYWQLTHGDPKIDNFIFEQNELATGLLDLDTVGRGVLPHDIGDCLRSCCNRAGENSPSSTPEFDLSLCRAVLEGYFEGNAKGMSRAQAEFIFDGLFLITFELGLRFFTDHLRGNTYFKVIKDGENLTKGYRQFLLADDIHSKKEEIRELIFSIWK